MKDKYKSYLEYINHGGGEVKIEHFEEDWKPIGRIIINEMMTAKLIVVKNGLITIKNPHQPPKEDCMR